jgi:hypothetical protein
MIIERPSDSISVGRWSGSCQDERAAASLTFFLALLIALQTTTPVWAWGRLGHRVTSRIAEKRLTPKAKAAVAELLEPGESLADASLWADEHRRELPKTAPWHYVDVPLDEPRYDRKFSGDVPDQGCVVDKINEFRLVIKDQTMTIEERRFALRFLIHCIEDMHMPLHVGDNKDKGGNRTQVRFLDKGTNIHRLWDSDMIAGVGDTGNSWLADLAALDRTEARAVAMKATVEVWARKNTNIPNIDERQSPVVCRADFPHSWQSDRPVRTRTLALSRPCEIPRESQP